MKIIIIGAGDVGYHIAKTLSRENKDVVLIEPKEEAVRWVNETLDVQVIKGSGSDPRVMKEAGIEEADMLIAVTNSDEVNMIACLIAETQAKIPTKIARVRNEAYTTDAAIFDQDHLDIDLRINPEKEVVNNILRLMEVPGAVEVVDFAEGKIKLIGLELDEGSPIAGKTLQEIREINPDEAVLVIAIYRNNQILIPKGKDAVLPGDHLFVVTEAERILKIPHVIGNKIEPVKRVTLYGGGNIGLYLAQELERKPISTKIICQDQNRCSLLVEELNRTIVLLGEGTDESLLKEENVQDCDFFISVSDDEEANVLVSLLAKQLGAKRVMSLVNRLSYLPLISTLGVDVVINPQLAAVNRILRYIRRGKVLSVAIMREEEAEAIEVVAMETSDLVNRPLKSIRFPRNAIIGAVVRNGETIIPYGETVIQPGDRVLIFARKSAIKAVEKALMVKLEYF